ncbi:MAG: TIGR01777 family oxidoreductase [Chlamydiota bacterium]
MRVLISGSSGFIGRSLSRYLRSQGHLVVPLVRKKGQEGHFFSFENPKETEEALEGFDAIVHLGGENIAKYRWTPKRKSELFASRVHTTKALCSAIERLSHPPKQFLTASGVQYFGSQGDTWMRPSSNPGKGFLAHLCKEWERSSQTDVCLSTQLRFGMVIGPYGEGSAIDAMLPLARWGLSASIGKGEQHLCWITIDDAVRAIAWLLLHPQKGPIHICTPEPTTQKEFAQSLAHALGKKQFLRLPAFLARLLIGEMAQELLLASTRVRPEYLLKTGFSFLEPTLYPALQKIVVSSQKSVGS